MQKDLEGEDDNLALLGLLHARVAVRLQARVGRERDLLLPRILPAAPRTACRHFSLSKKGWVLYSAEADDLTWPECQ